MLGMRTDAIPKGYDALIPCAIVRNAAQAIEFYKEVFGATEIMRMTYPNSPRIAHAEIKIRDHVLMLGDESPEMGVLAPQPGAGMPPASVMIYVPDVDAIFSKALAKGARSVMGPADMFWGDRYAKFMDPFGHLWGVATHQRDVSAAECAEGMAAWGKSQAMAKAA